MTLCPPDFPTLGLVLLLPLSLFSGAPLLRGWHYTTPLTSAVGIYIHKIVLCMFNWALSPPKLSHVQGWAIPQNLANFLNFLMAKFEPRLISPLTCMTLKASNANSMALMTCWVEIGRVHYALEKGVVGVGPLHITYTQQRAKPEGWGRKGSPMLRR